MQVEHVALIPTAVLLPPPLESLHCGLPSPEWPSDHISLLTKFTLRQHHKPPPPPPNPPNGTADTPTHLPTTPPAPCLLTRFSF